MSIRITTVIENEKKMNSNLENEFGLSLFIEDEEIKLLFDTGKSGLFIENAKKLNINLKQIDYVVLSHNHFDHVGGLKSLIENVTKDFVLCINSDFFKKKFKIENFIKVFLGGNFDEDYLKNNDIKIKKLENDVVKLSKKITLFTNFKNITDFEPPSKRYVLENKNFIDFMEDEIAISIKTSKGLLIICGCSHIGIGNIIEKIKNETNDKIYGIIGGIHLSRASDKRISETINYFKKNNIKFIGTSHCTGIKFNKKIKNENFDFTYNITGEKQIFL